MTFCLIAISEHIRCYMCVVICTMLTFYEECWTFRSVLLSLEVRLKEGEHHCKTLLEPPAKQSMSVTQHGLHTQTAQTQIHILIKISHERSPAQHFLKGLWCVAIDSIALKASDCGDIPYNKSGLYWPKEGRLRPLVCRFTGRCVQFPQKPL